MPPGRHPRGCRASPSPPPWDRPSEPVGEGTPAPPASGSPSPFDRRTIRSGRPLHTGSPPSAWWMPAPWRSTPIPPPGRGANSQGTGGPSTQSIDPRTAEVDEAAARPDPTEKWATHVEAPWPPSGKKRGGWWGPVWELNTFEGAGVYDPASPTRAAMRPLREVFGDLFATARRAGMAAYFRNRQAGPQPLPWSGPCGSAPGGSLDTTHPALWSL